MAKNIKPIKNKPEILSATVMPGRVVRLQWCDAVGAEQYIIKRYSKVDGVKTSVKLDILTNEFNTYSDTTIEEDGEYQYKIIAKKKLETREIVKLGGARVNVSIVSVGPPTLKSIRNEGKKIVISWDPVEDAYGYVVLRRFSFMKKATPIATIIGDTCEYKDGKFASGQLMYYQIQSIFTNGESENYSQPSNALCSVILDAPYLMKKSKKMGKKMVFNVRLTAGADGYILFRQDGENAEPVEVCRTHAISDMELTDATKKTTKEATYTICAYKTVDENTEFIGKPCEPIHIRF